MSDAVKIAKLAARWVRIKAHSESLRKHRGTFCCERAEPGAFQDKTQDRPCWKMWIRVEWDENVRLPEDEWCETCRQRESAHKLYTEAAKQRGIRNRALQAAARAWEPREGTDGE